jgi:hypothetical protein
MRRILFQCGAAARRIREDRVVAAVHQRVDIAPRQAARFVPQARMNVQRAAAALTAGHHHLAAILLQDTDGGLIQSGEAHVGDAPRHQRHPVTPLAFGGKSLADLAEEERRLGRRRKPLHIAQPIQQFQEAQCSHQLLQSTALV